MSWKKGLYGTPEEHRIGFEASRAEMEEAIADAREAMSNGQCLVAGNRIDNGYVAYGRMQANAYTSEELSVASQMLRELKDADEPFEKKCVRTEPVEHMQGRPMHMMRPALAGPGNRPSMEQLEKARAWMRREFNKRYDGYSHPSHTAAKVMEDADRHFGLNSFGVEGWSTSMRNGIQYLNFGDTYDPTIVARSSSSGVTFILARGGWGSYVR